MRMKNLLPVVFGGALALCAIFWSHCVSAAETVTYYYTNEQGTPLATTDATGAILSLVDLHPYGAQALGSLPQGPGYTGHTNDADSGLVYMQARYYDPMGRMLSVDPVEPTPGNIYSFSRYAYANNNPILNIDPTGLQSSDQTPCDIECKRQRQEDRQRRNDAPYTGGGVASAGNKQNDSKQPYSHDYSGDYSLCSTSQEWCSLSNGYNAMLHYAFPGQDPSTSAVNGQISEVWFLGFSGGHIQVMLDPAHYSLTNFTLPDHIFFNGYVTRSLAVDKGTLMLRTRGTGGNKSFLAKELNVLTWRPGFYSSNDSIRFLMVQTWLSKQD